MYAQEAIMPYSEKAPKKEQVERMFNDIAHSYDGLNHLLSLGVDRIWRKSAISYLKRHSSHPSRILDVATGTGDFAILANKQLSPNQIIGIDISEKMMEIGKSKVMKADMSDVISFHKEDCSSLSYPESSFDAVISSFGLRNFEYLDKCLSEMYRVLRPGGIIVAIDLCSPRKFPMSQLFWCYKKLVMPVVGRSISHDDSAYTYLPHTMDVIPQGSEMAHIFEDAGFTEVIHKSLPFQMCMLYSGKKTK